MVKVAVPTPNEFDALIVTAFVHAVVGVPVICPELILTLSPAGRLTALKLVGLLLAVIVYVGNAWPTVPAAVDPLVITGALPLPAALIVIVNVAVPTP
jgi:hypothetical protein